MSMHKDTHTSHERYGTKVPRNNGGGMDYHRRSSDLDEQIFSAKFGKVARWVGAIILGSFIAGGTYFSLNWRLTSVECKTQMLVDVVVWKKELKDIRTDC